MNFKFRISILVFVALFFSYQAVSAYEVETHAYLTSETIKFYNQHFPANRIPANLEAYLIDGARREDDPPRWMNHFYDPVYNRGLTIDLNIFSARDIAALSLVSTVTLSSNWLPSKIWAQNSNSQTKIKYSPIIATILSSIQAWKIQEYLLTSNFTWQEALRQWIHGNKEAAMFALGHIIHLIQDKTVPDHTRNDPHPGDSPYELYTHRFTLDSQDKNLSERLKNKQPFIFGELNFYFDELAKYSNNNFYSKDTIGMQSGYKFPESMPYPMKVDDKYFAYNKFEDEERPLFFYKSYNSGIFSAKTEIDLNDPQNYVVSDYWSRLSTKSVQYGAGVINLFFQEVEKYKNDPNFVKKEEKSFWGQTVDAASNLVSQTSNAVNEVINSAVSAAFGPIPTPQNIISINLAAFEQAAAANSLISLIPQQPVVDQSMASESATPQLITFQNQNYLSAPNIEEPLQKLQEIETQPKDPAGFSSPKEQASLTLVLPPPVFGGGSGGATYSPVTSNQSDQTENQNQEQAQDQDQQSSPPPLPEISNFTISYSTTTQMLSFSWDALINNSTSTINYILSDITNIASPTIVIQTTLTFATSTVNDFGRNYQFSLIAKDENNNLLSQEAVQEINIPANDLPPQSFPIEQFVLTANQWGWSAEFGSKNPNCPECPGSAIFQSIVPTIDFQLNRAALKIKRPRVSDSGHWPGNLRLTILADVNNFPDFNDKLGEAFIYNIDTLDGDSESIFDFNPPISLSKDIKYWLMVDVVSYADYRGYFNSDWRILINLNDNAYAFGEAGQGHSANCTNWCVWQIPNPNSNSDWYFRIIGQSEEEPPTQSPRIPGSLSYNFNLENSQLTVNWQVANDIDTQPEFLTYQINFSPRTAFNEENWLDIGANPIYQKTVAFGDDFLISVRAVDNSNNFSEVKTLIWSYPQYFFEQSEADNWIHPYPYYIGNKNPNCPSCPGTASLQSFTPTTDLLINRVALKIKRTIEGWYGSPTLSIYQDNGNNFPNFANSLGSASVNSVTQINADRDVNTANESIFNFSNLISFSANTKYWLILSISYSDHRANFANYDWKIAAYSGNNYVQGISGHGHAGSCTGFNPDYCRFRIPHPDGNTDWYFRIGRE